jgi:cytochrome c oxidase cbb3-type subunit 2
VSDGSARRRSATRWGERDLPWTVVTAAIVAVFAVNLVILGYAISISRPGAEATHTPRLVDVSVAGAAEADAETAPIAEGVPSDLTEEELEDELDWAMEPITVVNIIELPSSEEMRPRYLHHCAGCHGREGRGDGPAAEQLLPRPRDFSGSEFRYAASGADREHILADLERTISRGVPRSGMPGFGGVLTETEIAGLARYVLEIREQGEQLALPAEGIDLGERPPLTPELLARGKELYVMLSCNTCHGDSGRGDGMNAESLVDFQGRPVRPADFTSGLFKTGQTPEDLCRTVLRGVPGTPMVAYEATLSQENEDETVNTLDAWAVVAYIRSFAPRPRPPGVASGAAIVAAPALDAGMVSDPAHPAWLGVEPTLITVKPLQSRPERTTFVEVRAVRTADRIAICLDWRDRTMDVTRGEGGHPDAAAVAFGISDEVPALLTDVDSVELQSKAPLYIWSWAADRQYDAATGKWHSQIAVDKATEAGWYLFVEGSSARLPRVVVGEVTTPPGDADPRLIEHAVLEANAPGLGHFTQQPADSQSSFGTAVWSMGSWRVLMHRSLVTEDELDAQFTSVRRIPVSFAILDGSKGDHAGINLLSSWHWLVSNP